MAEELSPVQKSCIMVGVLGKSWVDSDPKIFALVDAAWKAGRESAEAKLTQARVDIDRLQEQLAAAQAYGNLADKNLNYLRATLKGWDDADDVQVENILHQEYSQPWEHGDPDMLRRKIKSRIQKERLAMLEKAGLREVAAIKVGEAVVKREELEGLRAVGACAKEFQERQRNLTQSCDSYGFFQADNRLEESFKRLDAIRSGKAEGGARDG